MAQLNPADPQALETFGDMFWLGGLQPLRAGEALPDHTRRKLQDAVLANIDQLNVEAMIDCGCSEETQVILTMPTPGNVDGFTALRAAWAGYMQSLKATVDSGKNDRAHIGQDPIIMDIVANEIEALGATATPCDEVYGSCGTYLEYLECKYDPASRTLTVNPIIGS